MQALTVYLAITRRAYLVSQSRRLVLTPPRGPILCYPPGISVTELGWGRLPRLDRQARRGPAGSVMPDDCDGSLPRDATPLSQRRPGARRIMARMSDRRRRRRRGGVWFVGAGAVRRLP